MAFIDPVLLIDVEELMVIGLGYDALIALVQARHAERANDRANDAMAAGDKTATIDLGGCSERTIQRYMKRVRDRWEAESLDERPERRKELKRKLNATFAKAYLEGGPSLSSAVQCLRIQAKVDGLEAPQQIEMTGQVNVKLMSPFQRQERIKELWAMRRAALGKEDASVIDVPATPKKLPAKKKTKAKAKAKPKTKAKTKARKKPKK